MLSLDTENLICEFLFTISDGEKNIDVIRQVLADQSDFDPFKIFKILDSENKGFITDNNLKYYLT